MEELKTKEMTEQQIKEGLLVDETVEIRPIRRKGGWGGVLADNHDSAFMNAGAKMKIGVPMSTSTKTIVDPLEKLDENQKKIVAKLLGLDSSDFLNIYKKDNYWGKFEVIIDRNGLVLNLSNIMHYITLKVLECNSEIIAPSWKDRFMKGTYKFAICRKGDERREAVDSINDTEKAYIKFGEINQDAARMKDFLYVYYLSDKKAAPPPETDDLDILKMEISTVIKNNQKKFLEILDDPNYQTKLIIQKAVDNGSLIYDGQKYSFPGSEEPVGMLEDMINFLNDDRNQTEKIKLMKSVDIF